MLEGMQGFRNNLGDCTAGQVFTRLCSIEKCEKLGVNDPLHHHHQINGSSLKDLNDSFQLQDIEKALYCYLLLLPPQVRSG